MASYNGQELRMMFEAATIWLERSAEEINSLNVFPVPDGDTGTNMLLTMRAAMEQVSHRSDSSASAMAQAMAWGSLMGARGNSGVILSQILHGLAEGLEDKDFFTSSDLATALARSSTAAYKAVSQPVEGTILTVIRDVAATAQIGFSSDTAELATLMEAVVKEARASVARTPSLLPVLRQAGVVDAGGQGLYVLLEGILRHLRGELVEIAPSSLQATIALPDIEEPFYGYCTEFLLQGTGLNLEEMRSRLSELGESLLVVGDDTVARVHIHTLDPGVVLSYATSLGVLHQIKVDNMQEQHRDFIAQAKEAPQPITGISIVTVVSGEGLSQAFSDLGAIILHGGESMNPSVQELLQAVDSVPSQRLIILPNNSDILPAAAQVQGLAKKRVEIVPTKTIPQGLAAFLAFNPESNLEENVGAMTEAIAFVSTGELTTAVRSMKWGELEVRKGQAIAFLDSELVIAADTMPQALYKLLAQMVREDSELITLYYGAEAHESEVQDMLYFIQHNYPEQRLEIVAGGQPYYNYIVSVE
jgi:hypothetical protein